MKSKNPHKKLEEFNFGTGSQPGITPEEKKIMVGWWDLIAEVPGLATYWKTQHTKKNKT